MDFLTMQIDKIWKKEMIDEWSFECQCEKQLNFYLIESCCHPQFYFFGLSNFRD